jgi:large subunit ribosomal protein L36
MRVRSAIKRLCKDCRVVVRKRRRYVVCKTHPRHKQRQGFHTLVDQQRIWNGDNCCDAETKTSPAVWEDCTRSLNGPFLAHGLCASKL